MQRNTMSFKAIINNIAKENNVAAQSVLQTYMLERLLERISISKYKDNFILKGGMLISAMLGIDSRTTMDMDTTIKGFQLTEKNVLNIMTEICNIKIDDCVSFKINKVESIREDDDYGGYRVTFETSYNNEMPVIMKIDITTGDKITYKEIVSFGNDLDIRKIVMILLGILFIISGNYMPKVRSNYYMNSKIFWVKNRDEKLVNKAVKISAYGLIIFGILFILSILFKPVVSVAILVAMILFCLIIYLYVYLKSRK